MNKPNPDSIVARLRTIATNISDNKFYRDVVAELRQIADELENTELFDMDKLTAATLVEKVLNSPNDQTMIWIDRNLSSLKNVPLEPHSHSLVDMERFSSLTLEYNKEEDSFRIQV